MPQFSKLHFLPWIVFLLAAFVLFYPVLNFQYLNFDDQMYIVADPAIKKLSLENLKTIFLEPYATAWYPLTRLTHAIEFAIFGERPVGTHIINVLLHFLNTGILFHVLLRLGHKATSGKSSDVTIQFAAYLACLFFLVHPQHIEAVAWAVQRKELLATFFALLSIRMYLEQRMFALGVFAAMAMMSKASTVTLPVLFVLLDITLLKNGSKIFRTTMKAVLANRWTLLLALVIAALTLLHHQAGEALYYDNQFSLTSKLLLYADNSFHGLLRFFTLQAELFHLPISEYVVDVTGMGLAILAIMVLLVVTASAFLFSSKVYARFAAAGFLFYIVALLPVGGLVVFGNFAFGDRYLYFSSLGIYLAVFICLIHVLEGITRRRTRTLVFTVLGLVIVAAFVQSHRVLPKWASTETIWKYDVEQRPGSVFANQQLGQHYLLTGRLELAYAHFSVALNSSSERFLIEPRTASALYMAEILCRAEQEIAAVEVLKKIPMFGGNVNEVLLLSQSLRHMGIDQCAREIEQWYRTTQP